MFLLSACIPLEPTGGPLDTSSAGGNTRSDLVGGSCDVDWDADGITFARGDCRPGHSGTKETCNGIDDDCDGRVDNGATGCYLERGGGLGVAYTWWKVALTACDGDFGGGWVSFGFTEISNAGMGCVANAKLTNYGAKPGSGCPDCEWAFAVRPEEVTVTGDLCAPNEITSDLWDDWFPNWGFDGRAILAYYESVGWATVAQPDRPPTDVEADENYAYFTINPASYAYFNY